MHPNSPRVLLEAEDGQDAAEYGLLVALIAIVLLVGVGAFGLDLARFWSNLVSILAVNL
jgi:Flp pilus assembly pilin Flp